MCPTFSRYPYHNYLRERWEQGVHNSHKLFLEIQKRGYPGGYSQVRHFLSSWRVEERERAFVRFETAPGEQSQFDWAHFGNFLGHHLYLFALTLCYSRMRYIEFTQRQDLETLLGCMIHAFHYLGGVTEVALTDNMKTVVLENQEGQVRWNARFLDTSQVVALLPEARTRSLPPYGHFALGVCRRAYSLRGVDESHSTRTNMGCVDPEGRRE